jgi:hypothetical protein
MSFENAPSPTHRGDGGGAQELDRRGAAIEQTRSLTGPTTQEFRVVVAAWARNSHETIQVALDQYQGRDIIDARTWYSDGDGTLRPTRSGLSLAVRHLPALADALTAALLVARKRGLLPDDGGAS